MSAGSADVASVLELVAENDSVRANLELAHGWLERARAGFQDGERALHLSPRPHDAFERAIESLRRGEDGTAFAGSERFAYWLRTCEGFHVDSDSGHVGIVEEVRLSLQEEPEALAVRAGVFGRRLVIVPVSTVERVVPRRRQVLLRRATA